MIANVVKLAIELVIARKPKHQFRIPYTNSLYLVIKAVTDVDLSLLDTDLVAPSAPDLAAPDVLTPVVPVDVLVLALTAPSVLAAKDVLAAAVVNVDVVLLANLAVLVPDVVVQEKLHPWMKNSCSKNILMQS